MLDNRGHPFFGRHMMVAMCLVELMWIYQPSTHQHSLPHGLVAQEIEWSVSQQSNPTRGGWYGNLI